MSYQDDAMTYYSRGQISFTELGDILRGNLLLKEVLNGRAVVQIY